MDALVVPEDVGQAAAMRLLEQIQAGGVVDADHQSLLLIVAALGPAHINQVGARAYACELPRARRCWEASCLGVAAAAAAAAPPSLLPRRCVLGSLAVLLSERCQPGPAVLQVRLAPLAPYAVHTLRHIKEFLGVKFDVKPEPKSKTLFCQCIGAGVKNLARRMN
jgi:hypothetical protein